MRQNTAHKQTHTNKDKWFSTKVYKKKKQLSRERIFVQQMVPEQLDTYMQEHELQSTLHPYTKWTQNGS